MNDFEVMATAVTVCETVATRLTDHGLTASDGSAIPVDVYDEVPKRNAAQILVEDESFDLLRLGNTQESGIQYADDGSYMGQRHKYVYEGNLTVHVRYPHGSDCRRATAAIRNRFLRFQADPESFHEAAPTAMYQPFEDPIIQFNVGSTYPVETNYAPADAVSHRAFDFSLEVEDVLLDEDPVPIAAIDSLYYLPGDDDPDHSTHIDNTTQ